MDDPGLRLLGQLLDASHDLAPDELAAVVTRAARAVDAEDGRCCIGRNRVGPSRLPVGELAALVLL